MPQTICIVRLSALGDALMLVPLIRTLQAGIPEAALTWVISRPAYDLVEGLDGVEFIVIDKPNHLRDYWAFRALMRARQFDVLLAAQASLRANLLYPFIKAKRKIGYDAARAKDGHGLFVRERIDGGQEHTLEGFLKFAEVLGIHDKKIVWSIPLSVSEQGFAAAQRDLDKPLLFLVNPAASKPERSWPAAHYIEVIQHVKARWQAQVILTGGPGGFDQTLTQAISEATSVRNLAGKTRPKELLALIQQANLLLCPDTGPAHMASAVNTPVIALHAVTNPDISAPYLYRDMVVNYYPKAVNTILGKTIQDNIWGTQVHGEKTMQLISVKAVIEQVDKCLSKR